MEYLQLGRTELHISRLCLGTMTFGWSADEAASHAIMDAATEAGINFFDTADIYSSWIAGNQGGESETIIGKWLKGRDRSKIILATKVRGRMWEGPAGEGLSRDHILRAVEDSLRRLQTDYIDLYQVHFPDEKNPLDETLHTLDMLVRQGKVRYIGVSNYSAALLREALTISANEKYARFDCLQPHYSLLHRAEYEHELAALCAEEEIGVIPYSPLAAGFLTGKYTREQREADTTRQNSGLIQKLLTNPKAFDVLDQVRAIAERHQSSVAHVALAWLLAQPTVTAPIIGARTVEQLQALIGAVALRLSADDLAALDAASQGF